MKKRVSYKRFEYHQNELVRMVLGGRLFFSQELRTTFHTFSDAIEHSFDPVSFAKLLNKGIRIYDDSKPGKVLTTEKVQGKDSNTKTGRGGSSRRSRHRTKTNMHSLIGQYSFG